MAKKATKRALLSSALALVVCISMLIGTTYAWFTDSVTSTNNIIKSGNLDIELEYWTGTAWESVEDASDVITNTNFEPGVTEVAYLRLANAGSLALKYQLGINIVSETEGKNAAGETFKLSDYVMFGVVENVNGKTGAFATREEAVAAITSAKKISAGYTKAASMTAGDELYFALVVYMPETVDNVANHDGKNVPQIDLGINVFATQQMAENDSFGPDYDEEANLAKFVVTNEAELVAALEEAKNGDVIGIKGNVTWTTGAGIGSTPFVENATTYTLRPVENPLTYITLLGIGDDATFTAIGQGVGAIGIDNGTVTFKNLKIADNSVSYAENSWEYGYLEFRGNTVFENCEIVNAIMMEGDSATFKNCSFNSNDDNQYAVWVSDGVANFEDCVITGARGIKIHEAYGSEVDTVVVKNNKFIGLTKKPGLAIGDVNADTTIVIQNNTFAGTQAGDQGLYSYETDTDVTDFDFTDKDNIIYENGATTTEQLKKLNAKDAEIYMAPGVYNTGNISLKEGVTLIGDEGVVIEGTLTSTMNNVTVQNVTIKGGNAQRNAYAKGDIVFENCTFEATGVYAIHFDGTTGANILYKNCKIVGWVAIAGGHNSLTFEGCEIYGNGTYGVIRTYGDATVKNCTFDVKKVNTNDIYEDGLHAVGCTITVENCKNVNGDVTDLFNTSNGGKFVMDGAAATDNAKTLDENLNKGENVVLLNDLLFDARETTADSGYKGATGVSVKGGILDGNGKSLGINNWGTYDVAIHTTGGTIKNLTVNSGFRGIFMTGATGNVYIDNVVIDGTIYTFNSDAGDKNYGVYISNSTLNGWTSHSDVHKEVVYTNCSFGEGNGYAFCRPYGPTSFVGCDFEAGFEVDAVGQIEFKNCTIGGVALTADNLATLVTSGIDNASVK